MTEQVPIPIYGERPSASLSLLKEASGALGLSGSFVPRAAAQDSPGLIVTFGETPDWLCDHIIVHDLETAKAALLANWDGTDSPFISGIAEQLSVLMGRFVQELPRVKIEQKVSFTRLIVDGDEDRRRERQDRERKERFGDDAD